MLDEYVNGERVQYTGVLNRDPDPTPKGRIPKGSGALSYGSFRVDNTGYYFRPTYLSYGDYDNSGTIERSNVRVFEEQFASLEGREWWRLEGGHGTVAIALRRDADERHEELREFFEGLDGYPVADEGDLSEMEMEQEQENWREFGADGFKREIAKYVPAALEPRLDTALESDLNVGILYRSMAEATDSYPEHEGTSTIFHEREMVWRTLAKMTDAEWASFLSLFEDPTTDWNYGGNGYETLRDLHDRQVPQDEQVRMSWERFGRAQFKEKLREGFRDTWGFGTVDKLTETQKQALEAAYSTLYNLTDAAYDALAWDMLFPIWDEKHQNNYQAAIRMTNHGPAFNMHWMTRHFARWAMYPEFAVLLDALAEGETKYVAEFAPVYREFFAQQH